MYIHICGSWAPVLYGQARTDNGEYDDLAENASGVRVICVPFETNRCLFHLLRWKIWKFMRRSHFGGPSTRTEGNLPLCHRNENILVYPPLVRNRAPTICFAQTERGMATMEEEKQLSKATVSRCRSFSTTMHMR